MNSKLKALVLSFFALTPIVTACSSKNDPDGRLLGSEEALPSLDDERARKEQMLMINVEVDDEIDQWSEGELLANIARSNLCDGIGASFSGYTWSPTSGYSSAMLGCTAAGNACQSTACGMVRDRCIAQVLARLGTETGAIQFTNMSTGAEVRILPQSSASRVTILESASRSAALALETASQYLSTGYTAIYGQCYVGQPGGCSGEFTKDNGGSVPDTKFNRGECTFSQDPTFRGDVVNNIAITVMRDAPLLLREARQGGYDASLAVADGEWGSTPSRELGARRAMSAGDLSRASAAHLVVGGVSGIEGDESGPLCGLDRLSPQGKAALDIFRTAAPHPDDVLDESLNTTHLVNGGGTTLGGSVRQRLSFLQNLTSNQPIWSLFGLNEGDFSEARQYLKEEIVAFSRSRVVLEAPGDGVSRYAATASPPQNLPAAYYMALALSEESHGDRSVTESGGEGWGPSPFDANSMIPAVPSAVLSAATVPGFPDSNARAWGYGELYAAAWARYATGIVDTHHDTLPELKALGPIAHQLSSEAVVDGTVIQCDENDGLQKVYVGLFSDYLDPLRLRFVSGEDKLRCAVNGDIEGAKCALTGLGLEPVEVAPFRKGFKAVYSLGQKTTNAKDRWYLLHGKRDDMARGTNEALAGWVPYRRLNSSDTCRYIPFGRTLLDRVEQALAPNSEWCTASRVSCAGATFDERLPLENELSEDGDGVESSWRYYLDLAEQAATESDLLATEYLNAKHDLAVAQANQEEKALSAMEDLQAICGTSIDAQVILESLTGGGTTLALSDVGACDPDSVPPVDANWECVGGRRIVGWRRLVQQNEALKPLADCLAADSAAVGGWLQLGNVDLCAWKADRIERDPDTGLLERTEGGVFCGNGMLVNGVPVEFENPACPVVADGGACEAQTGSGDDIAGVLPPELAGTPLLDAAGADPAPYGRYLILEEDGLNFFDTASTLPPQRTPGICDDIRTLRTSWEGNVELMTAGQRDDIIDRIEKANLFEPLRMEQARKTMALQARYGGYLSVRTGGEAIIDTGNTAEGTTTAWPCSTPDIGRCPEGVEGLFCDEHNCEGFAGYQVLVNRLVNAVGAAKYITAQGEHGAADILPGHLHRFVKFLGGGSTRNLNPRRVRSFSLSAGDEEVNSPIQVTEYAGESRFRIEGSGALANIFTLGSAPDLKLFPAEFSDPSEHSDGIYDAAFLRQNPSLLAPNVFDEFFSGLSSARAGNGIVRQLFSDNVNGAPDFIAALASPLVSSTFEPRYTFFGGEPNWGSCANLEGFHPFDSNSNCLPGIEQWRDAANGWLGGRGYELFPEKTSDFENFMTGGGSNIWDYETPGAYYSEFPIVLSNEALWDAAELLCEVTIGDFGGYNCGDVPPPIRGPDDLDLVGQFMQCQGDRITYSAATTVFRGVPKEGKDILLLGGTVEGDPGSLQSAYSALRSALGEIAKKQPALGGTVRSVGYDLIQLEQAFIQYDNQEERNRIEFESTAVQQAVNCIAASAQGVGLDVLAGAGKAAAATATCANSVAQVGFANSLRHLGDEDNQAARESAIQGFNSSFDNASVALQTQEYGLSQAFEEVANQLGIIASLKLEAGRALNRALWFLSDEAGAVDSYAALGNLANARYQRAHGDAQRVAFLAKRAVEQRLGVSLSSLSVELPLVEAPQRWESGICQTSPIDYSELVEGGQQDEGIQQFADQFIGDYVNKLRKVVESYRLEYGFQDGSDRSVVSLRDDIMKTRDLCKAASPNLLTSANDLLIASPGEPAVGKWRISGCDNVSGESPGNCVSLDPLRADGQPLSPFSNIPLSGDAVGGFQVTFGDEVGCDEGAAGATFALCDWAPEASLGQVVTLGPGYYAFSWYHVQLLSKTGDDPDPVAAAFVESDDVPLAVLDQGTIEQDEHTWGRSWRMFKLETTKDVHVGFSGVEGLGEIYFIGAPMLEKVDTSFVEPSVFAPSDEFGMYSANVCPDLDGSEFRDEWRRGCVQLCDIGYSGDCPGGSTSKCYWETSFHLSQWGIESGRQLSEAGFASGNFNYRLNRVAVNLVGSGLRDCAASSAPQSCYSSGNLSYSLYHLGPFYVRNHFGDNFEAMLFDGRIERARALASERYISNPVGSADADLLEQFMRTEFQGRPMDGTFVVRVWDEPGVQFNSLEDVQLVFDYGYWTRNN